MPLPRTFASPQTGPILNRPLQGFAMAVVTAVSRLLRASPPFVGADSISARGTPRRRGVPGWLPRSSHSVGRAFTPAAHWQFQNRALPRREHPREGHGPPLRTGTDATAIRLARNIKFIRRGGIDPARGHSRRRRSGGMRASRPMVARMVGGIPFGWAFATVCRGGACPSRGRSRRRRVPGTMQASSPT